MGTPTTYFDVNHHKLHGNFDPFGIQREISLLSHSGLNVDMRQIVKKEMIYVINTENVSVQMPF